MNNLFNNIQKYRPRVSTNPKENFTTEVFAYILNCDKKLLSKFIKLLDLNETIDDYYVCTQVAEGNKIIDMEIIINDSISIFIENKINSSINKSIEKKDGKTIINNQLENYLEIQKSKENPKCYVVLLSQYSEKIDKIIKDQLLSVIRWENVYSLLENHQHDDAIVKFLSKQFLGFMEVENMSPYKKINKNMINEYYNFRPNMKKLFENIINLLKDDTSFKKIRFSTSVDYISYYFWYNNVKFSLDFDRDGFSLFIYDEGLLSKAQKESLNVLDSVVFSKNYYIPYEIDEDFEKASSKKQREMLENFYLKNFETVKTILKI